MLLSVAPGAVLLFMGVVALVSNIDPKKRLTKVQGNRLMVFSWLVLVAIFIGGGVVRTLIHGHEMGRYWIGGIGMTLMAMVVVLLTTKLRTWGETEGEPELGLEQARNDRPYLDDAMTSKRDSYPYV
jgi:hypothetical protein